MQVPQYVPHVELLLQALRVSRERLNGRSKIAIDPRLLRRLVQAIVERSPFSGDFYLQTYPDIAAAHAAGTLSDPHRHFVETGYFEGRLGAPPTVDEDFYMSAYKDVGQAVRRGEIASATEHYVRQGAAEGRLPNPCIRPEVDDWMAVLLGESGLA